jgi:hypothetical protein
MIKIALTAILFQLFFNSLFYFTPESRRAASGKTGHQPVAKIIVKRD